MNHFTRRADGALFAEEVALEDIAEAVGTPTYVYSRATITRHYRVFDEAWRGQDHQVCYAVKAASNLAILRVLAELGSGFDIVSGGELRRVLAAGGNPSKVVFSGVGKTEDEMDEALDASILCFNVESEAELETLSSRARARGLRAPVSLRINPDVDPGTHPYVATGLRTSKFGIPWSEARRVYGRARELDGIEVMGMDCHIGSQLADAAPMVEALRRLLDLVDQLETDGIGIRHLDVGGGLGITYDDEKPPSPAAYAAELRRELHGRSLTIVLEPGRVIMGNAGVLLMRTLLTKSNGDKRFVVVDAAMNDAIRPALYGAYHGLEPVGPPQEALETVDVVGPVCETGDFFARDRELPVLAAGDLLIMRSIGAYGFAMASNYNSRRRPAEVLVDQGQFHVIRTRETWEDLWRHERDLPVDA